MESMKPNNSKDLVKDLLTCQFKLKKPLTVRQKLKLSKKGSKLEAVAIERRVDVKRFEILTKKEQLENKEKVQESKVQKKSY